MVITRLALDHFRSWDHCVVDFAPGVTLLQGANGLGKTNIVEAIEVLATGTSHRVSSSAPLVERGFDIATIRANVEDLVHDTTTTYEATIRAKGTNRARINGGQSLYLRDIIGKIPVVSFTPQDQQLVSGDPSTRRQLLNQTASLLIHEYPTRFAQFTHVAKQRAALLKQLGSADHGFDSFTDSALTGLEIWTGQYIDLGLQITRDRMQLIEQLQDPFAQMVSLLTGGHAHAQLLYDPSFDEIYSDDAAALISQHFQRLYRGEIARGQNLIGPQRDDMTIMLDGMPAREFASNGEMWTLGLALKMAVYQVVKRHYGRQPIVILDDVFAQLDEDRRAHILRFAQEQEQVFITVAAQSDIPPIAGAHIVDVQALRDAMEAEELEEPIAASLPNRALERKQTGE